MKVIMKKPHSFYSAAALMTLVVTLATGCAWSVGGSKTTTSSVPGQPTLGQELIDLKNAHEQGAISDEEYEKAKAGLIEQ